MYSDLLLARAELDNKQRSAHDGAGDLGRTDLHRIARPRQQHVVQHHLGSLFRLEEFHFQNIARGVIDSRNLLYFASVCFVMLYATVLVVQEKK